MTDWKLILLGILLSVLALSIEIRHKIIWDRSLTRYQRHALSRLIDTLLRPSKLSYRLNVYLIWPLVFLLGLICIYLGLE